MISENKIIKTLQTHNTGEFIGDDGAILPHTNEGKYIISKDLLIEDIHFRTSYFTPKDLAHKSLHVNLSDMAAMGAKPLYALCGISIPNTLQNYAVSFLNALTLTCQSSGVILIGGDTVASAEHLMISITVLGIASETCIKKRNGAKVGDLICIAGNLGFAHLGFLSLEQSLPTDDIYIQSFLHPEAKIQEGIWLGQQSAVTSMMDISDGLYTDLSRLCSASSKGAVLDMGFIQTFLPPNISLKIALEGGEDYGLLMTLLPASLEKISHEFLQTFGYDLKIIGHITDDANISFKKDNQTMEIKINPFTHFGEKS